MSQSFWKKFHQKQWEPTANIKLDVITVYCGLDGMANKFSEEVNLLKLLPKDFYIEQKYVDDKFFHRKDQFDLLTNLVKEYPDKVLHHFIKRNYELFKPLPKFAKQAAQRDLNKLSNGELSKRLADYIDHYTRALTLVTSPMFLEPGIMKLLEGLPAPDLLFTEKETATNKERVALLGLAASKKDKLDLKRDLQIIANKFSFTGFRFFEGVPRSIDDYHHRITEMRKSDPKAELERLKFNKHKLKIKKRKLLKKLKLTFKQRKAIEFGSEITFLRTYRLDLINKATWRLDPLLQEICSRLNLSRTQLIYLTPQEIIDYLQSSKQLDKKIIEDRIKNYAAFLDQYKKVKIFTGSNISKVRHQEAIMDKSRVIRGIPASKGQVRGRVKILSSLKKITKFKKGDVLVAQMTTPDWIPLMEKAKAVVTDIGGLTSHAAIVSRELGKPCVVGTKIATKILENGDIVEVDANKGIINIIEKN